MTMFNEFLQRNVDYGLFLLIVGIFFLFMELQKRRRLALVRRQYPDTSGDAMRMGYITHVRNGLLAVLLIAGWFFVQQAEQEEQARNEALIAGIAPTFAYELQQKGHESVRIATTMEDPKYLNLLYTVMKWMVINPDLSNIYTIRKLPDGSNVYVIAPEHDDDADGTIEGDKEWRKPIGLQHPGSTPELEQALRGLAAFQKMNRKAKKPTVTTYVPLYDRNGRVDAVVGVDFDATIWRENIGKVRRNVMAVLLVLTLALNAFYWNVFINKVERFRMLQHQSEVAESEGRFRKLIDATFEGVMLADQQGRILSANRRLLQIFGYRRDEMLGMKVTELVAASTEHGPCIGAGEQSVEVVGMRKDDTRFAAEVVSTSSRYKGERAQVIAVRDISERKRSQELINYMAYHDALTGLPNRVRFHERLSRALDLAYQTDEQVAVLFLDLDRFKMVNDTLGHEMGDRLLKGVAARLIETVPAEGIVARMGGDEFTVLLPGIRDEEQVAELCREIIDVLNRPLVLDDYELHTTTSIGISLYPQDGEDAQGLMKNADTAMYRAKEAGRNNYAFYLPAMNGRAFERLELENGLRHAVERGELTVYYQPRLNIGTGQIMGMEALVRWNHPRLGLVSPGDFIPLAEETGLIVPIGEWVLRTACFQNKSWVDRGYPPMRVAVNLSARQFQSQGLVDVVDRALEDSGLPPEFLELEITESITMQDVDFTIETLHKLSERGIQISIDDFGTGYSSLNYLKRFPIHTLKIDQSFVRELTLDAYNAAIVTTVIYLAQNLKLKVIAEGVETEEQLHFLREHKCDEMQGYLFSRPVPAAQFEELLDNRRSKEKASL